MLNADCIISYMNKLVIVTGEFGAPDAQSSLFPHRKCVNDMVITWILNTVADDISSSMNYMDSAYSVWSELNERFVVISGHKIYETQRDLFKLEQGNNFVEFYFHKLKGYWDELKALEPAVKCTCDAVKDWEAQVEKNRLIQFLMGLHSSFTAARGQLLMMQPWPTVNQAFMLIKQEEKQRQIYNVSAPSIAMMVGSSSSSFKPLEKSENVSECSHCHLKGHTRERCYKLIGYPPDHPSHPNNKGKRIPGGRFNSQPYKSGHVMQVSGNDSRINSAASNAVLTTQIEALQNQMNTLMQCFNKPST